jgi:DNA-directed RNA polymerase subunit RPC12/RpoP
MSDEAAACPRCGSTNVEECAYKPLPPQPWGKEIDVTGCLPSPESPTHRCVDCGKLWGRLDGKDNDVTT